MAFLGSIRNNTAGSMIVLPTDYDRYASYEFTISSSHFRLPEEWTNTENAEATKCLTRAKYCSVSRCSLTYIVKSHDPLRMSILSITDMEYICRDIAVQYWDIPE